MDQNKNIYLAPGDSAPTAEGNTPDPRPIITSRVTRGCQRLLTDYGNAVLIEMKLANGRRADVVGLTKDGSLTIIEVKSCRADFDVDSKWPEYLDYCDHFYFAVPENFPLDLLPTDEGVIIADEFGGAVIREPQPRKLSAARRKATLIRFARQAAFANLRLPETQIPARHAEGTT